MLFRSNFSEHPHSADDSSSCSSGADYRHLDPAHCHRRFFDCALLRTDNDRNDLSGAVAAAAFAPEAVPAVVLAVAAAVAAAFAGVVVRMEISVVEPALHVFVSEPSEVSVAVTVAVLESLADTVWVPLVGTV